MEKSIVKAETINFTELVLNGNPDKSLDFQSRMVSELRAEFDTDDQKWFIANFYMYLNYHQTEEYPINLENVWKLIGFRNKGNAKRTLENNFTFNEDYKVIKNKQEKVLLLPTEKQKNTENRGGVNKENIMLNIDTFKNLCMIAKTDQGKKIRRYHIKLENIYNKVLKEDYFEYKQQLEQKDNEIKQIKEKSELDKKQKDNEIKQVKQESELDKRMAKHNTLVQYLKDKKCIYLQEVKTSFKEQDIRLIKIGSSKNIQQRSKSLQRNFDTDGIFLEVFDCNDLFRDIEQSILNDPLIRDNKYRDTLDNGHVSHEIVKLSSNFNYNQLVTLINKHIKEVTLFEKSNNKQLDIEREKLNAEREKLNAERERYETINNLLKSNVPYQEIINILQVQLIDNNKQELKELTQELKEEIKRELVKELDKECKMETKNHQKIQEFKQKLTKESEDKQFKLKEKTKNFGRKILKINPDNLDVVEKTYKDIADLLENERDCSETGVRDAIRYNRVYKDYRWVFEETKIEPTVASKSYNIRIVLELDNDCTRILKHYSNFLNFVESLNISKNLGRSILKNKTKYNDKYYAYYQEVEKTLIDNYPYNVHHAPGGAVKVKSIHPLTKQETIFPSLKHAHDAFKIHHKTVHRAIKEKRIANGHYWEYVGAAPPTDDGNSEN